MKEATRTASEAGSNGSIKPIDPLRFSGLAVLVGIIGGVGAVVFRALIAFVHNLLFLGRFSIHYDATVHTAESPWGFLVVLVPVLGSIGVAFLVTKFAPEAKGHGVPEVMEAIYYKRGVIRPAVAAVKSLASALSIGSGGSVGREGPIIQIGSTFGSTLGQFIPMPSWQVITLIAAGAGAGIAATFNTPVGGVLFAAEILLHEVSVRTLVPVAIATAVATYLGQVFFGVYPAFMIPDFETPFFHLEAPQVLFLYVGLGIFAGLVSVAYIRSIYGFEDFFERRIRKNYFLRHAAGMLVVGLLILFCMKAFGHYHIEGVGYATIQDILNGHLGTIHVLLALLVLKLLAVSLTLGSGASGGIFSPALFMGATLGGAYGAMLHHFFPGLSISPPAFAVAGMAGIVAASTGAGMAAIVMIFEMTLDYNVILPITLTVAIASGVRWFFLRETLYTMKLVRRGHHVPKALQANFHYETTAREMMDTGFRVLPGAMRLQAFADLALDAPDTSHFIVDSGNGAFTVASRDAALAALRDSSKGLLLEEVPAAGHVLVREGATLMDILGAMGAKGVSVAVVVDDPVHPATGAIRGILTQRQITDSLVESAKLYV